MGALRGASRELVPERELAPDAQRLDLWYVPERERLAALAPFGLLWRMAEEGPYAFELFHQAPSLHEVLSSLRKAFYLRQPAQLPPREDEPWLWIIAGGRPNQVLKPLGFRAETGWPRGVYAGPSGLRVRLVVTGELPRTPETLLLRILGAGKTLRLTKSELHEIGLEDPRVRRRGAPKAKRERSWPCSRREACL